MPCILIEIEAVQCDKLDTLSYWATVHVMRGRGKKQRPGKTVSMRHLGYVTAGEATWLMDCDRVGVGAYNLILTNAALAKELGAKVLLRAPGIDGDVEITDDFDFNAARDVTKRLQRDDL